MNAPQALPVGQVYANPLQPRKTFPQAKLEELARSIALHGVMQPITVVPRPSAHGSWMVVMGERRLRATLLAKKDEILAIVREDLTDGQVAELALVENLLREDLNVVEEARAYQEFIDRGYTVEKLAEMLGVSQPRRIQERLDLLKLVPQLLDGLKKGAVTPTQAGEMSRLSAEGQWLLWSGIQDGKCPTSQALRQFAQAILDRENQVDLFQAEPLSAQQRESVSRIQQFIGQVGKLRITPAELEAVKGVAIGEARLYAEQLALLEKMCRDLKNALLANAAKQELVAEKPKKGKGRKAKK